MRWFHRRKKKREAAALLALNDEPTLVLRPVRPYGRMLFSEQPPWRCKVVLRLIPGVHLESFWGVVQLSQLTRWCDDMSAEISGWAGEWGADAGVPAIAASSPAAAIESGGASAERPSDAA